MRLYAGVDGGQSSTLAVVGDDERILGTASGPPADLVGLARTAERQADAIDGALAGALAAAGFPAGEPLAALVAGLSGFDAEQSPPPRLRASAARVAIVHDTEIAHAGAFAGGPGTLVLAGTGSVALARDAGGRSVRVGGWGAVFGDAGSAYWIGRRALSAAMEAEDRGARSPVGERACASFGVTTLRAIQLGTAHGEIGRPAIAAFAREVVQLAAALADGPARAIVADAHAALAELGALAWERLGPQTPRRFSYAGGLFADDAFAAAVAARLAERVPGAQVDPPRADPATGALLLARRLA